MSEHEKINVVVVEPLRQPYKKEISNTLQELQEKVGGHIEIVMPFEDMNACLICNEEGKLMGLPYNREVNGDIIVGTFMVAGLGEDIASLTDKQIEVYKQRFNDIEFKGAGLNDKKIHGSKHEK